MPGRHGDGTVWSRIPRRIFMLSLQVSRIKSRRLLQHFTHLYFSLDFSEAEPKGSDCYDQFATMQECFARYPTVYNKTGANDEDGDDNDDDEVDKSNLFGTLSTESDVDTVDQIDETDKAITSKSDDQTESSEKSASRKKE